MNKTWILLIVLGVVFLVVAVGWEVYQSVSGNRSTINTEIVEYSRNTLLSPKLENFLNTDPDFPGSSQKTSN